MITTLRMRRIKIVTVGVLSFLALALGSTDAVARDVCLKDQLDNLYIFKGVAPLRPGQVISLVGLYSFLAIAAPVPITGGATLNTAGTTANFGIFVHSLANSLNNFTAEWTGDKDTFAGSGAYDNGGTYQSSGALALTNVDCKTVTLP